MPAPIAIRWGSWLDATKSLSDHCLDIISFCKKFKTLIKERYRVVIKVRLPTLKLKPNVARVLSLPRECGKVKLDLKFQLLFDSSFLFCLVRRVTNAPIVVSVNTAVALRWSFCLLKIGLRSFYQSTFGALQASRTKLRKFKQQGFYER